MAVAGTLASGRAAFRRRAWADAFADLSAADEQAPLDPEDLDLLVTAAFLVGRDDDAADLSARAYRAWADRDEPARAARCAFWLGFKLLLGGETARGGGWLARAERLLEGCPPCAEQGLVLIPTALERMEEGDPATALALMERSAGLGERYGDSDVVVLSLLGQGQARIRMGEIAPGVRLLDEVMIAATVGEVSPIVVGIAYCAVIEAGQELFDLRRVREWTGVLTRWCASQPDLVPYRGQCLVHRAEIMQLQGAWPDALDEARRACDRLADQPAAGLAYYQLAEVHRLRGEFAAAEDAYQQASRWIRDPQPGLALLRLAQGHAGDADAAIRRVLDATTDPVLRCRVLAASVETALAVGDVAAARTAVEELAGTAQQLDVGWLHAVALHAGGLVRHAEGDGPGALDTLRSAWTAWQELDVPYEAARVRVAMGLAYRQMHDEPSAGLEFDAARWVFERLGAAPDLAAVAALDGRIPKDGSGAAGLTPREVEVLRLVAAGHTNRAIAADLFLSEKTVARHVSNIFGKLGVSSRSAATAYAFRHGLADT